MLKTQKFTARVGKVEVVGKVTKATLGTSENQNAGKKKSDGSWEDAVWVYSNWFATFFGDTAKKLQEGDVLEVEEATLSKKLWEHDGKKDYPLSMLVFDGKWGWKSKGAKKHKENKEESNSQEETDSIPF